MRGIIGVAGLLAMSMARADPPAPAKVAPSKVIGQYRRVPGDPENLTSDKASTCGEEASTFIRKMADKVGLFTVQANSVKINDGKSNPIVFVTNDHVISNVILDRDDRWTTALRIMFIGNKALILQYNKVERETADWCSDSWGVLLQRN
jgi:hypothetical protein